MKLEAFVDELRGEIHTDQASLDRKLSLLRMLEAYAGEGKPALVGVKVKRTGKLAKKGARRRPIAPGSLGDRIVAELTSYAAPMRRAELLGKVKAPADAVAAELKRQRDAGTIVLIGEKAGARWSLPKFTNVIVADDSK